MHLAVRQSEHPYTDIHGTLSNGYPLFIERKPAVVETLLAHGARTDLEDDFGLTPLHWAVRVDIDEESPHKGVKRTAALKTTELLIEHGADVDAQPTDSGRGTSTPLNFAAGSEAGIEIVTLLLNHGADIDIGNESVLYSASHNSASNDEGYEVIKLLLDRGAAKYVNTCTETRGSRVFTPFMISLDDATTEVVELFLEYRANVNSSCEQELPLSRREGGTTREFKGEPLHEAARNPDPRVTLLLLDLGADVNAPGPWDETPLFSAANHEVAEVLLQYGADPNARSVGNMTPLLSEVAFGGGGDIAIIETLLKYGANVNARSDGGYNALHYMAGRIEPEPELVKLFLDRGVSPHERANNGRTPCHIARDDAEGDDDYPEVLVDLFCG